MNEKIYVKGFRSFPKHEKAPEFVLGTLIIDPNEFIEWLKENKSLLSDYKDRKQLKCQVLKGNNGLTFIVDTYKKEEESKKENDPLFK